MNNKKIGPLETKFWILKKIQEKERKEKNPPQDLIKTNCYSTVPESLFTVYATPKIRIILTKEKKNVTWS